VQRWFDEQERQGKPIYIYGGGFHTMGLLGLVEQHNGSIRAILDDDSTKHGSSIEGLKVMPPALLQGQQEVAVIISTLVGEERILERLRGLRKPGWEIKTIYKDARA
jgi:FlaA1/EpsC-like NDP-sugar epimerase